MTAKLPSDLSALIFNFDASNFETIGKPLGAIFTVWGNGVGALSVALAVFTLMLSDFFDTAGTIVGLGERAGLTDKKGRLPGSDRVLFVDSVAAAVGGAFGVSSNTTYIESAAGIEEGGRTGLASVVTGALFLVAILLGGLQNAGSALQGPDFPSGLVGVMGGMISATVLAVFMVPLFFVIVERIFKPKPRHHDEAPAAPVDEHSYAEPNKVAVSNLALDLSLESLEIAQRHSPNVSAYAADVTEAAGLADAIARITAEVGPIDRLVHAAVP